MSPFVEIAVHSNGSVLDGQDNESTLAVLALCVALALALASLLLVCCVATCFETLPTLDDCWRKTILASLPQIDSGTSPPLSLRI